MKKVLILLIIFTSCHFPRYTHSGNVNSGLDFNKGKWLLNEIESPKIIKDILTNIAVEEFTSLLGDRFSTSTESKGALIPGEILNNPSKSSLRDIKSGTGFDYFIDIRAKKIKNEIGDLQIGQIDFPVQNSAEITIAIYDLNLLEKIYFQSVFGHLSIQKSSSDFAFARSSNNLILAGFNKIMKKIKKNKVKY